MLNTTVGQLLINDVLPEELRDLHRVLDKKGLQSLLQQVAQQHPERYRDISFQLNHLGQSMAQQQGGMSFGLRHMQVSKAAIVSRQKVKVLLANILADDTLTDQQRNEQIILAVGKESPEQQKQVLAEALKDKNPLGLQVMSGTRGKSMNLTSLLGSDMLYSDQRDAVIPIPVLHSYSEGLSPAEYWAGTYGARKGIMATKFATQEAGFFNKQLNQTSHRLVVTGEDAEEDKDAPVRGLVVDTEDADNEGALLARDSGPYARNTPLTPKILNHLQRLGYPRILVRSPLVGGSPEGGVYSRDVGIRETGRLPGIGEQIGLQAAHALSEPISQGQLSAKHSGGVAGQEKAVSGFQYLNQLVQVPKKMQGGAAHSLTDGTVQRIEAAPAGGSYVTIGDKRHYVGVGYELKVKKGDEVEAGDVISTGIPNPATITEHKGIGEGRRYFVNEFRKAMGDSGMFGHRRNVEVLARGLINHVRLTEETDDNVPDDIVPYSTLEHTYKPRADYQRLTPKRALGQYLERPVLHYTIGTKIQPSMLKNFEEFKVNEIPVHKNPPPFEPHMVRGLYQMQHDPDWMTQMYGSGLKKSFLDSVTHGAVSEERGTSFVPSLALGLNFGEGNDRAVIKPKSGATPPFFGGSFTPGQTKFAADTPNVSAPPSASKPPAVSTPPRTLAPGTNIMPTAPTPVKAPTPAPTYSNSNANQFSNLMHSNSPFAQQTGRALNQMNPLHAMMMLGGMSGNNNMSQFLNGAPQQLTSNGNMAGNMMNGFGGQNNGGMFNNMFNTPSSDNSESNTPTEPDSESPYASAGGPVSNIASGAAYDTAAKGVGKGYSAVANKFSSPPISSNIMPPPLPRTPPPLPTRPPPIPGMTPPPIPGMTPPPLPGVKPPAGMLSKATSIGGTGLKLVSKAALPLSLALDTINVGQDIYNKGWTNTANDTAQNWRDILSAKDGLHTLYQAPLQVLNPVANAQLILEGQAQATQLAREKVQEGLTHVYDKVTGTDTRSRNSAADKTQVKNMELENQRDLEGQRARNQPNPNMPADRLALNTQENARLDAQIQDSKTRQGNTVDETANWRLGKQDWFGSGGHKFRDSMQNSITNSAAELQGLNNGGTLDAGQQARKEQLENRQAQRKHMIGTYDREGGASGKGLFSTDMRNRVSGLKENSVQIGSQLRDPNLPPDQKAQLEEKLKNNNEMLEEYRGWAESSK